MIKNEIQRQVIQKTIDDLVIVADSVKDYLREFKGNTTYHRDLKELSLAANKLSWEMQQLHDIYKKAPKL